MPLRSKFEGAFIFSEKSQNRLKKQTTRKTHTTVYTTSDAFIFPGIEKLSKKWKSAQSHLQNACAKNYYLLLFLKKAFASSASTITKIHPMAFNHK